MANLSPALQAVKDELYSSEDPPPQLTKTKPPAPTGNSSPLTASGGPLLPPPPDQSGRIADLHAHEEQTEKRLAAINEATGALQPPTAAQLPPPPQPKNTNPLEIWGSSAMTIAAIGSLFTRGHLTTALNSAAAVMKAYKQNDLDAANAEFERWKASSELAIKQQNFQMEAYKAALQKASVDEKGALAQFQAYAHAFGDETAAQVAQTRGMEAVQRLMLDYDKNNEKLQENADKIVHAKSFMDAYNELQQKPEFQKADAATRLQMVSRLGSTLSDSDMEFYYDQWKSGDNSVFQNMGRGAQASANVMAMKAYFAQRARDDGLSGADIARMNAAFQGLKSGYRALGTTAARINVGRQELEKLIPQALEASKNLPRTEYPTANAVEQAYEKGTGDARVRDLALALQAVKGAYAQVLTRGGASTDAARATADELFNTADPHTVIETAMARIRKEGEAVSQAPTAAGAELPTQLGLGGSKPKYSVGQVIDGPDGKKYRVTGGDMNDPDV